MPIVKSVPVHTVQHIWEAYADKLLKENAGWIGRRHNKIRNFYLFKPVNGVMKPAGNYARFRKILERYFDKAKTAIIHGEAMDMGGGLGRILAIRVERDFTKKSHININWKKTLEYTAIHGKVWDEVKQKLVHQKVFYFTDDDWCRISWSKAHRVFNEGMYQFDPTRSNGIHEQKVPGFTNEFKKAINADSSLKYRFLYKPIYIPKQETA